MVPGAKLLKRHQIPAGINIPVWGEFKCIVRHVMPSSTVMSNSPCTGITTSAQSLCEWAPRSSPCGTSYIQNTRSMLNGMLSDSAKDRLPRLSVRTGRCMSLQPRGILSQFAVFIPYYRCRLCLINVIRAKFVIAKYFIAKIATID